MKGSTLIASESGSESLWDNPQYYPYNVVDVVGQLDNAWSDGKQERVINLVLSSNQLLFRSREIFGNWKIGTI